MKSIVIAAVVAVGMAAAGTASAQEALAKSSGCMNCHDIATKKMGPAFKEVAAKYKGKADAEAMLVAKLSAGQGPPRSQGQGRRPQGPRQVGAVALTGSRPRDEKAGARRLFRSRAERPRRCRRAAIGPSCGLTVRVRFALAQGSRRPNRHPKRRAGG